MAEYPPGPERDNADLVLIMKRPAPVSEVPSAQGVGLYTHISQPGTTELVLVPPGGPCQLQGTQAYHDRLPAGIKEAWEKLKGAIEYENKNQTDATPPMEVLKERYWGLDTPDGQHEATAHPIVMRDSTLRTNNTSLKRKQTINFEEQPSLLGPATGGAPHGASSIDGTLPLPTKRRNIYEADRDPRRKLGYGS